MKTFKYDLNIKLKDAAKKIDKHPAFIRKILINNANLACAEMERVAKEHTPNKNDGKPRGNNVISGSLQESWTAECIDDGGKISISLSNSKPYAGYVQYGHILKRHFVPWLYKDSSGMLSYEPNHNQKMFGLFVGTKTKYVKGVDMVGPAIEEFNKVFDKLNNTFLVRALTMLF